VNTISLLDSVSKIVDNRGKTCPTSGHGITLIATNCVKSSNLFPTKERTRFVNQHTYDNWFRGHPQPGDILFVNKGSPGEVCLVPDDIDFCFAQDMVALRANKEKIDPLYLFAVLRSKRIKDMIHNMHVGTMIPHFKKSDFKKIYLPLPKRQIQEFIGNYYYSFSKKIHLNQKINQNLEEITKTLFKSWFIDFDLVRSKLEGVSTGLSKEISDLFPDSFEDSELGEIPKGWNVSNIGTSLKVILGGTPSRKRKDYWNGKIPWINSGKVNNFRVTSSSEFITKEGYDNSSTKMLPKRSTLIAITGATLGQISINEIDVCANQSVIGIPPSDIISPEFVYLWINSNIKKLISSQTGGAQQHINKNNVEKHLILIPSNKSNKMFQDIVKPIFDKISTNIFENKILIRLRDILLSKLISGELTIYDVEKINKKIIV